MRLRLDQKVEEAISDGLTFAVIVAALLTIPLTIAYWIDFEHIGLIVLDWLVWTVFVVEYAFYMAISRNRWETTKHHWLSVLIVIFSFPLLHEVLKSTRLVRLVRPVPLLRQAAVLQQVELLRLSNMRSAGSQAAITEAKKRLGKQHWVVRSIIRFEYYRSRIITALLDLLPFVKSRVIRQRREKEQEKSAELEGKKSSQPKSV